MRAGLLQVVSSLPWVIFICSIFCVEDRDFDTPIWLILEQVDTTALGITALHRDPLSLGQPTKADWF